MVGRLVLLHAASLWPWCSELLHNYSLALARPECFVNVPLPLPLPFNRRNSQRGAEKNDN